MDHRHCLSSLGLAGATLVRVESKEELRQLEFANTKSDGASSKGSGAAVSAIGFLCGRSCWDPLQSSLLGSVMGSSVMRAVRVHSIHERC